MYFFTHASTAYRRLLGVYSATFKRKPSEGVGHDLTNYKSLVQVYRLFGFHPWGDPAGVSLTAPNDVYRVPESPNGQPVHRATYLSHHSPPRGSALCTTTSKLQTPETSCNSWTEIMLINKSSGVELPEPNVW